MDAMTKAPFHVAIVGGGLCGLILALALEKRNVSYTIYEAHASFTEIGAGLNLGPNSFDAFNAIDPTLRDRILALATRHAPGQEDLWMNVRLGAPTNEFPDAHLITALRAPPTGNTTASRNELLQLLANSLPSGRAKFNKRLVDITQSPEAVKLSFADGLAEVATVAIACDGVHSTARKLILGHDHPAAAPRFSQMGGYRAVIPMELHEQVVGADKAHMSHIWCGPGGYVITYPIEGGRNVNVGLWVGKDGEWSSDSWVLKQQKAQMLKDFGAWGSTIHNLMDHLSQDTHFWAGFHHAIQPEHYFAGRVCLIGDSCHTMPPHQGQGASQAVEDACVISSVLQRLNESSTSTVSRAHIEAAYLGFEAARKDRFEAVIRTSVDAFYLWSGLWRTELAEEDLRCFERDAAVRFERLWNGDIVEQQRKAVAEMARALEACDFHRAAE